MRRTTAALGPVLVALATLATLALGAGPANAHATFPNGAAAVRTGADVTLTMNVPVEIDAGNKEIRIAMPPGFTPVNCSAPGGWTCATEPAASTPQVVFTACALSDVDTFRFTVHTSGSAGSHPFKTIQRYSNGVEAAWIDTAPGASHPAPSLNTSPTGSAAVTPPTPSVPCPTNPTNPPPTPTPTNPVTVPDHTAPTSTPGPTDPGVTQPGETTTVPAGGETTVPGDTTSTVVDPATGTSLEATTSGSRAPSGAATTTGGGAAAETATGTATGSGGGSSAGLIAGLIAVLLVAIGGGLFIRQRQHAADPATAGVADIPTPPAPSNPPSPPAA